MNRHTEMCVINKEESTKELTAWVKTSRMLRKEAKNMTEEGERNWFWSVVNFEAKWAFALKMYLNNPYEFTHAK